MDQSLASKTFRGLAWSFVGIGGENLSRFFIQVILARILLPSDYGQIGMIMVVVAIAGAFIDSGYGQALIQKKDATFLDECSVFYYNILVSAVAYGVIFIFSPTIAAYFRLPELAPLIQTVSVILVVNAFGLIQRTLLTKKLDFKTQTKVSMTSTLTSGAIGIAMAKNGLGVWSLVGQQISMSLIYTTLLWYHHKWRPKANLSLYSLKRMFGFGSRILAAGLLNRIVENIYIIIIGRLFPAEQLGYYVRAKGFQSMPVANLSFAVERVTFPVFSSLQDEKSRTVVGARKSLSALAMLTFPLMMGMMATAKPFVSSLITEKWLPCVPYLQLLCLVGMIYPLHVVNLNLLLAQRKSGVFFRLEVIKKSLIIVALVVTYQWGISAMIIGQITANLIAYLLGMLFISKVLEYRILAQIEDILPYFISAIVMGMFVFSLERIITTNDIIELIILFFFGAIFYIILCRIMKLKLFIEVWDKVFDRIQLSHR